MRHALYALVLCSAATVLCLTGTAAGGVGALVSQIAASAAVLGALVLLLSARWPEEPRSAGLLALLLTVLATPLASGLTGGWDPSRLVVHALGAVVAALWWQGRGRVSAPRAALGACLAGVAAALSASALGLLLLLGVAAAGDRELTVRRRAGTVALIAALGGVAWTLAALARGNPAGWGPAAGTCATSEGGGGVTLLFGLFSSRGGLLYAAPILWLGVAGWLIRARDDWRASLACGSAWLLAGTLVIASLAHDIQFDALVPTLALGLAQALVVLDRWTRRWPLWPAAGAAVALVVWNLLFMAQYRNGIIPRDDTVPFARVAEGAATTLAGTTGAPLAWPGNWIGAWRYQIPLDRFEQLSGLSLFPSATARQSAWPLAEAGTSPFLLDGWGSPRPRLGRVARRVTLAAVLVVPIDCREPLDVVLVAGGPGAARLAVNDAVVATWAMDAPLEERRARVGADFWRRPLSRLSIQVATGGEVWVESIAFVRASQGGR